MFIIIQQMEKRPLSVLKVISGTEVTRSVCPSWWGLMIQPPPPPQLLQTSFFLELHRNLFCVTFLLLQGSHTVHVTQINLACIMSRLLEVCSATQDVGPALTIHDARAAPTFPPGYKMGRSWQEGGRGRGRCGDGSFVKAEGSRETWGEVHITAHRKKNAAAAAQPWGQREKNAAQTATPLNSRKSHSRYIVFRVIYIYSSNAH